MNEKWTLNHNFETNVISYMKDGQTFGNHFAVLHELNALESKIAELEAAQAWIIDGSFPSTTRDVDVLFTNYGGNTDYERGYCHDKTWYFESSVYDGTKVLGWAERRPLPTAPEGQND